MLKVLANVTETDFSARFEELTKKRPLSWQWRLFRDHFAKNDLCPVIDLPTGLGKTMIMAIWLIAREAMNVGLPRRLIYVVDRRTVVDQATDLAKDLQKNFGKDKLSISTLRGQLADNREWMKDPSKLAIIIGTVDLVGSGLLFSGYRSGYKRRPLEAGLLGHDSLLVLDEAHLSRPFEKLIKSISGYQQANDTPLRVIRMSATSGTSDSKPFQLIDPDFNDSIVNQRFNAQKSLSIKRDVDPKKFHDEMAAAAIKLAEDSSLRGKRVVVFARKPEDARVIAKLIREHVVESVEATVPKPKKIKNTPYADSVDVLTGTMRGLERDKLVEKVVFKDRWLNGDLERDDESNQTPVFLVATSAGEVGFDLNADHMVSDATTIDSLIQRLGRVNRRGNAKAQIPAQVRLIVESAKKGNDGKPRKLEGLELAIANTIGLLHGIRDVSPKNIAELKSVDWKEKYAAACSPDPVSVELTDILLDAWSMTSISEPMPGRPEVGPWLRGIDDEQAQTTVAWRAELDLVHAHPAPEKALRAIFTKHPIRPHESLTVNTGYLLGFLKRIPNLNYRPLDLMSTRVAVRMPRGEVNCRTLQQLTDEPGILYAGSTLILPAKFGGVDCSGMLDAESISKAQNDGGAEPSSFDIADRAGYEQTDEARSRLRIVIKRSEGGAWAAEALRGGAPIPDDIQLDDAYAKSTALFNDLKAADLRVRLVQPIRLDDEGNAVESLVVLAPAPVTKAKEDQLLTVHVGAVEREAERIANALHLTGDSCTRIALLFAARWHDEGKKAHIWQTFANNPDPDAPPLGKMAQSRDPKSLRGYRHEFGSLLRIHYPDRWDTADCVLPATPDTRDLALHLIATHHGGGRPHFQHAAYDSFTDAERDDVQIDVIRRFARLQKRYGWWYLAWLENLLRCADALASAGEEATEIDEAEGLDS